MTTIKCSECGKATQADGLAAGYAVTETGARICYDCAGKREVEALKAADKYGAYLSADFDTGAQLGTVRTWTGAKLMDVTRITSKRRIGGWVSNNYYYFKARDVHGNYWTGSGHGGGINCRLRRVKKVSR